MMPWNQCHIMIDENHSREEVVDALHQLADLSGAGLIPAARKALVLALRSNDGIIVGAATFFFSPRKQET